MRRLLWFIQGYFFIFIAWKLDELQMNQVLDYILGFLLAFIGTVMILSSLSSTFEKE